MTFVAEYGISRSFDFPLFGLDDNGISTAECVLGDIKIIKDGGSSSNTINLFTHLGSFIYSIVLTYEELMADEIKISIIDQTGSVWKDCSFTIRTNNAF